MTSLTLRSLLSLRQPEIAFQQYLYIALLCLYVSIYHFVLLYPCCFLTGKQYSPLFDLPNFPHKPKELWKVRWNKGFCENMEKRILGPMNKVFPRKSAATRGKSGACLSIGVLTLLAFVVPKLVTISKSNSTPSVEDPLFVLVHSAALGLQLGLEKILGKNVLPERFAILASNMFFLWSAPLLVTPFNQVVDMCAPPMMF
ncbi:hypothetical protein K493DRAFT_319225 [Basidiobolus meristosporus CBS 931.73]|uniref:Uncharacterized protein n=1 Tax=Basidiobolus meristosporus CBS 931.73 TaxID=1314790 RepID=A0A1Y1XSP0_9FUNG|nr:hypothetical protein K493DRAFT_319225 [Basidiobolus meristosporus CBS 931.73]|eukprot:ORX88750.1 hypothetical protein K493DRAFT_319225 [Basidiobolus meristosporus CBS 931.73]